MRARVDVAVLVEPGRRRRAGHHTIGEDRGVNGFVRLNEAKGSGREYGWARTEDSGEAEEPGERNVGRESRRAQNSREGSGLKSEQGDDGSAQMGRMCKRTSAANSWRLAVSHVDDPNSFAMMTGLWSAGAASQASFMLQSEGSTSRGGATMATQRCRSGSQDE